MPPVTFEILDRPSITASPKKSQLIKLDGDVIKCGGIYPDRRVIEKEAGECVVQMQALYLYQHPDPWNPGQVVLGTERVRDQERVVVTGNPSDFIELEASFFGSEQFVVRVSGVLLPCDDFAINTCGFPRA